jgi:hypothetical protein
MFELAKHVHANFQLSSFYPDGLRIFWHFFQKNPAIKIGLIRARWKALSAKIVLSLKHMVRPKSQNSNIRHDGTLSIRNFWLMLKKPMNSNFEPLRFIGFNGHDPAKVPKVKYRHDGALSIRKAQLIISLFVN